MDLSSNGRIKRQFSGSVDRQPRATAAHFNRPLLASEPWFEYRAVAGLAMVRAGVGTT